MRCMAQEMSVFPPGDRLASPAVHPRGKVLPCHDVDRDLDVPNAPLDEIAELVQLHAAKVEGSRSRARPLSLSSTRHQRARLSGGVGQSLHLGHPLLDRLVEGDGSRRLRRPPKEGLFSLVHPQVYEALLPLLIPLLLHPPGSRFCPCCSLRLSPALAGPLPGSRAPAWASLSMHRHQCDAASKPEHGSRHASAVAAPCPGLTSSGGTSSSGQGLTHMSSWTFWMRSLVLAMTHPCHRLKWSGSFPEICACRTPVAVSGRRRATGADAEGLAEADTHRHHTSMAMKRLKEPKKSRGSVRTEKSGESDWKISSHFSFPLRTRPGAGDCSAQEKTRLAGLQRHLELGPPCSPLELLHHDLPRGQADIVRGVEGRVHGGDDGHHVPVGVVVSLVQPHLPDCNGERMSEGEWERVEDRDRHR